MKASKTTGPGTTGAVINQIQETVSKAAGKIRRASTEPLAALRRRASPVPQSKDDGASVLPTKRHRSDAARALWSEAKGRFSAAAEPKTDAPAVPDRERRPYAHTAAATRDVPTDPPLAIERERRPYGSGLTSTNESSDPPFNIERERRPYGPLRPSAFHAPPESSAGDAPAKTPEASPADQGAPAEPSSAWWGGLKMPASSPTVEDLAQRADAASDTAQAGQVLKDLAKLKRDVANRTANALSRLPAGEGANDDMRSRLSAMRTAAYREIDAVVGRTESRLAKLAGEIPKSAPRLSDPVRQSQASDEDGFRRLGVPKPPADSDPGQRLHHLLKLTGTPTSLSRMSYAQVLQLAQDAKAVSRASLRRLHPDRTGGDPASARATQLLRDSLAAFNDAAGDHVRDALGLQALGLPLDAASFRLPPPGAERLQVLLGIQPTALEDMDDQARAAFVTYLEGEASRRSAALLERKTDGATLASTMFRDAVAAMNSGGRPRTPTA